MISEMVWKTSSAQSRAAGLLKNPARQMNGWLFFNLFTSSLFLTSSWTRASGRCFRRKEKGGKKTRGRMRFLWVGPSESLVEASTNIPKPVLFLRRHLEPVSVGHYKDPALLLMKTCDAVPRRRLIGPRMFPFLSFYFCLTLDGSIWNFKLKSLWSSWV